MKTVITIILLTAAAAAQTGTLKMRVEDHAGHGVRDTEVSVQGHSCAVNVEAARVDCDAAAIFYTFTFDKDTCDTCGKWWLSQVQAASEPLQIFFLNESFSSREKHILSEEPGCAAVVGCNAYEYTFPYRVIYRRKYSEKIAVTLPSGKQITIAVGKL